MSVPCNVIIQWSATPEQLSALGCALWRWCTRMAGNTGIYQYLDNQALADLMAGNLPVSSQPPLYADRRGVHFRVRDEASNDHQATLDGLRRELPTGGIEDVVADGTSRNSVEPEGCTVSLPEKPMPNQSKVITFDVDEASLISLRQALPGCVIDEVNGATAASLTRDWDPGTVDLVVVEPRKEVAETLDLCRFLVSCGVLARDAPAVTDSQEETSKTLGLHRYRRNVGRRAHSPLLVLVPPSRESIVSDLLKAGAHSCLILPIDAKDVTSMLVHAQAGNQPGRHTVDLERAQTEDRWRDDGGQG